MATSLATRCPSCSTVFRVVRDQLRVSEGWVRCGRCAEVFKATDSLVDLDTGAPRRWDDPPIGVTAPRPAIAGGPAADRHRAPARIDTRRAIPPDDDPSTPRPTGDRLSVDSTAAAPGRPAAASAPSGFDDTLIDPTAPANDDAGAVALLPWDAVADERGAADPAAVVAVPSRPPDPPAATPRPPRATDAGLPSFVRSAQRAERWRRPRVRAALAATGLLLMAVLAGQVAYEYRDLVAARFPESRSWLTRGCALIGCRIEAARAIDALAVESSGLVRIEQSGLYRLSLALRNRAGIELALPAVELSLTDTQGRLVVRRVLHAAEFGASPSTLAAGRELPLQATLQASLPGADPVAGYTIELFYP